MSDGQPQSREEILQDWLLNDTKELFESARTLTDVCKNVQAALERAQPELQAAQRELRSASKSLERVVSQHDEKIRSQFSNFELGLVTWAKSYRRTTIVLLGSVVFVAALAGSAIGAITATHLHW